VREERTLSRAVDVTVVPYGDALTLEAGSIVYLMQALGGSFTAMTERGYMVRIDGQDADAIGETPPAPPSPEEEAGKSVEQRVWDQLKTCYDPEIPINIVELGLVYSCEVQERPEGGHRVAVQFTLTAPGCGMGDFLREDIRRKVLSVAGVAEADVQMAFTPPWSSAMMSDAARLQLGLM